MMDPTTEAPTAEIVNRVANSGLVTLNLEDYRPQGPRALLDIKDQLFMGLILREKDFRAWCKEHDWAQYAHQYVAVTCTADAVVPTWAYMLVATLLQPHAAYFAFATPEELEDELLKRALDQADWAAFEGQKVVVKGCGGISTGVYVHATRLLRPYVAKLMYGEPCSTVPLYKR
jgi:hypothetical protein